MGSNEGHAWMYLGGVGHVELIEGFFWVNTHITSVCGGHQLGVAIV